MHRKTYEILKTLQIQMLAVPKLLPFKPFPFKTILDQLGYQSKTPTL